MTSPDRRSFLTTSASLAFLADLPSVSAQDAKPNPKLVHLDSGIEPLVRVIEDTPREKLLEEMASRIKKGLAYRDVLAALLLAGVRNVEPRPSVGFKFHAVLVVNSAHQAAMAGPANERWLPLFWALDNFKASQARNIVERDGWRMKPVDESKAPSPERAREQFISAMEDWDEERADSATAILARTTQPGELFDLYARFGSRDFRSIGHKIIFVANAFRCLEVIGWHHAEPVLRSLSYALLNHDGKNPSKNDLEPDRPGRRNLELAAKLKAPAPNRADPKVTATVLTEARTASANGLSDLALSHLKERAGHRAVWDGLFLAGGELLMRQPGIVALHSLTTLNALHYAARTTSDATTRNYMLLQGAAFVPLFREAMTSRDKVGDAKIDALFDISDSARPRAEDVFRTLSKDKRAAANLAMTFLAGDAGHAKELMDEGRRLIFLKGTDAHDYKFSSAIMEDAELISPAVRDRFLAASLFWLKGTGAADSPVAKRTRAALA